VKNKKEFFPFGKFFLLSSWFNHSCSTIRWKSLILLLHVYIYVYISHQLSLSLSLYLSDWYKKRIKDPLHHTLWPDLISLEFARGKFLKPLSEFLCHKWLNEIRKGKNALEDKR
jgi:hypothetical protein